jgi:hypothetical protein
VSRECQRLFDDVYRTRRKRNKVCVFNSAIDDQSHESDVIIYGISHQCEENHVTEILKEVYSREKVKTKNFHVAHFPRSGTRCIGRIQQRFDSTPFDIRPLDNLNRGVKRGAHRVTRRHW